MTTLACPKILATSRGFTLVESIIVMVVLAIAAVAIISLQGNIFRGKADNQQIQVGVQMMQACAEKILAIKRISGYAAPTSSTCNDITNTSYDATAVPIPTAAVYPYSPYTDPSLLCVAANSNCHMITITLGTLAPISLLLVN